MGKNNRCTSLATFIRCRLHELNGASRRVNSRANLSDLVALEVLMEDLLEHIQNRPSMARSSQVQPENRPRLNLHSLRFLFLLGDARTLSRERKLCLRKLCRLRGSPQKHGNNLGTIAAKYRAISNDEMREKAFRTNNLTSME